MLLTSTTHTPHPGYTPEDTQPGSTRLSVFMGTIRCLVNRLETQSAIDFCLTPCLRAIPRHFYWRTCACSLRSPPHVRQP